MSFKITLDKLKIGEKARVLKIEHDSDIQRRLWDLGLINGSVVEKISTSPMGDPSAFLVKNTAVALRNTICKKINAEIG